MRDLLLLENGVVHRIKEAKDDSSDDEEDASDDDERGSERRSEAASSDAETDAENASKNGDGDGNSESVEPLGDVEEVPKEGERNGKGNNPSFVQRSTGEGDEKRKEQTERMQEVQTLHHQGTQMCDMGFLFGIRQYATLIAAKRTTCLALSVRAWCSVGSGRGNGGGGGREGTATLRAWSGQGLW